jgi:hypothetical protein
MFNVMKDDADLYRLLCKISETTTKKKTHLFCLPKQNGCYELHYKCSKEKGLMQAPDGENTSLNKVVTDHSQKASKCEA